jgi:hypothetical protein
LLDASGIAQDTPFDVVVPPFLAEEAARLARGALPSGRGPALRIRTDAAEALARAPRAIAFPGTITLELARNRVPTLVLAVLDPLTYTLGRRLLAGRRLALPNLILGEEVFPEWAGTAPGPDPIAFRALWDRVSAGTTDGRGPQSGPESLSFEWDRRLAALEARLGPGDGARVAVEACLGLLRSGSRASASGFPRPLGTGVAPR